MDNLRIRPDGITKLLLYIILGTMVLMVLPHLLRLIVWVLKVLSTPPELPVEPQLLRLTCGGKPFTL